jgi:hypothetical protein
MANKRSMEKGKKARNKKLWNHTLWVAVVKSIAMKNSG